MVAEFFESSAAMAITEQEKSVHANTTPRMNPLRIGKSPMLRSEGLAVRDCLHAEQSKANQGPGKPYFSFVSLLGCEGEELDCSEEGGLWPVVGLGGLPWLAASAACLFF